MTQFDIIQRLHKIISYKYRINAAINSVTNNTIINKKIQKKRNKHPFKFLTNL